MPGPIVFVHVPKTAGTSLRDAVVARLSPAQVRFDYIPSRFSSPAVNRARALVTSLRRRPVAERAVFGHFLAMKYGDLTPSLHFRARPGWTYVTFLRDPLARALSHYHFLRRVPNPASPQWQRFAADDWHLERFLFDPELRDLQSQFLWRFPLAEFHVVGVTERLEASLRRLGQAVPELAALELGRANARPDSGDGGAAELAPALRRRFEAFHARDYALYSAAVREIEGG